jgi:hypothetical protein
VSILQTDTSERELPSKVVVPTEASIESLEAPRRKVPKRRNMPVILWTLLLVFGILMLLVRLPVNAPDCNDLTQYVCDPLPRLPNLGNRFQSYSLNLRCRAGDQVVFQRQAVNNGSNMSGLKACKLEGGLTRIWRMAPPSAYGAYVFHSTCGDHTIMYYKNRAAVYESTQRFIIVVAYLVILVSVICLTARLTKARPHIYSDKNGEHSPHRTT